MTRVILLIALGLITACRSDDERAAEQEAREAMLFTVTSRERLRPDSVTVLRFRPVRWRDSCLEIQTGGACAQQSVPGYRLRIRMRGGEYEYRASAADPSSIKLADAPDPELAGSALRWQWTTATQGCQQLVIDTVALVALGWCDGALQRAEWLPELPSHEEWQTLYGRFSPFTWRDTLGHALDFRGIGNEAASPAWRSAVARWAALRWSELNAGRSGAGHGRALAYRAADAREPGMCDVLEVTEYGVAYAGRSLCKGGGGVAGGSAWLSSTLWYEFDALWRALAAFEEGTLMFAGQGQAPLTPEVEQRLRAWCERAIAEVRAKVE